MNQGRFRRLCDAFSLVELLVVMAIIGTLVARVLLAARQPVPNLSKKTGV